MITWDALLSNLTVYTLVFCRMTGMIAFNPLLSRKNLPTQFKLALALGLAILVGPSQFGAVEGSPETLAFVLMIGKELFIGLACGLIFQFFYYMLFLAGDVIDTGFGLSMAKVFDPGTSIQMSLSGNLFQFLFVMYFFATDCHLLFIKLMVSSYDLVGLGQASITGGVGSFAATLFVTAFSLAMRLAIPFLAASFILEVSMGILMKLIPQISVFVIHFQLKIFLGFMLLFLFASPVGSFVSNYIDTMFMSIQDLFRVLGAS